MQSQSVNLGRRQFEDSLNHKNRFQEIDAVVQEYFDLSHAEAVPIEDMSKDPSRVFYLPMHVVYKSTAPCH